MNPCPRHRLCVVLFFAAAVCPAVLAESEPTAPLACGSCLFVVTDVPAEILLGAFLVGKTPMLVEVLTAGTKTLTIRSGALVDEVTLEVDPSRVDVVRYYAELRPRGGTLSVSSDPPGAAVFLDGTPSGVAPVSVSGVKAGVHRLRLELAGHEPQEREATVVEGSDSEVSFSLAAAPAGSATQVRIAGLDSSCFVILDGESVGEAASRGELSLGAGAHSLLVAKDGFVPLFTRFRTGGAPVVVTYRPVVDASARNKRRGRIAMPLLIGGAAAAVGGLVVNADRIAIEISSSYEGYAAVKYATLGTACAGVVCSLVGLLIRLL